jgi:ABC-type antimicrobial peptide transport system permease subunit
MRGGGYTDGARLPGQQRSVGTAIHHGTARFLEALGVPVVAGRGLTPEEVATGAKVAVIGEDLVRALGMTSPIGARFSMDRTDYVVVGVARAAHYSRLTQSQPVSYVPFDFRRRSATVVIRTSIPPLAVLAGVRQAVTEMDRNLPLVDVYTMEQQISRTLQRERLFAWLCGSFGALALVLCVVGLYGLMSHSTARRTSETGIRMALGATRQTVMGQVVWDGMKLAGAGLLLGIPLALYCAWIATTKKLIPDGPLPYWTLAAAAGILAFAALAAVIAPAVRASSVDPMRALRRG